MQEDLPSHASIHQLVDILKFLEDDTVNLQVNKKLPQSGVKIHLVSFLQKEISFYVLKRK